MINNLDNQYRFRQMTSTNPISHLPPKFIPQTNARRFVDTVEKKLSSTNFKHKSKLPLQQMEDYAERRRREGFTNVVFGHFHEKVVMPAGDTMVTVVPPWYESGEAMVINPQNGAFDWIVV